jgi:hypothetical protein
MHFDAPGTPGALTVDAHDRETTLASALVV